MDKKARLGILDLIEIIIAVIVVSILIPSFIFEYTSMIWIVALLIIGLIIIEILKRKNRKIENNLQKREENSKKSYMSNLIKVVFAGVLIAIGAGLIIFLLATREFLFLILALIPLSIAFIVIKSIDNK